MPDLHPAADPGAASVSASAGNAGLPKASQLEQMAASFASAHDPLVIARMANALFTALPGKPVPGPGAALPSAPLFSVEPAYASIPGAPSVGMPQTHNNNPGIPAVPWPGMGAAQPSAPGFAAEPRLDPGAAGRPGATAPASLSFPSSARPPAAGSAAPVQSSFLREPDFSALPAELASDLSFVPRFDDTAAPFGAMSLLHGPVAAPAKSEEAYYFLKYAQPVAGPAAAAQTTAFDPSVQSVDLGSLASQHRPEIASAAISGVRLRCSRFSPRFPDPRPDRQWPPPGLAG